MLGKTWFFVRMFSIIIQEVRVRIKSRESENGKWQPGLERNEGKRNDRIMNGQAIFHFWQTAKNRRISHHFHPAVSLHFIPFQSRLPHHTISRQKQNFNKFSKKTVFF